MSRDIFDDFFHLEKLLSTANRPLRLRLAHPSGTSDDMLLPQKVLGSSAICGALEYRVLCLSTSASVPLKELIALPAALDFVTDRGKLHSVCGIITEAAAGDSDGGIATYQLVLRDALSIMEKRINTRVFRHKSEVDIVKLLVAEWRQSSAVLASAFDCELDPFFDLRAGPPREFIMQHNESDAAFIRRLLKRRGVAWYFRAGRGGDSRDDYSVGGRDTIPAHTLVLFNNPEGLRRSAADTVRYHRDAATEQRDTLTSWSALRTLQPGRAGRHSWEYDNPLGSHFMRSETCGAADQGGNGNELAASLDDYQVLVPHAGKEHDDLCRLGQLAMQRHDLASKCFHAEGGVRDLPVGEYFTLLGHPEIDTHPAQQREFVVTALRVSAQNNLPRALAGKAERLFARNGWLAGQFAPDAGNDGIDVIGAGPLRLRMQLTAVRRGIPIVPAFDEAADLPHPPMQSALVVGPVGEEVHCDQFGRVKIRFSATRPQDHGHTQGAGAADNESDSAWVRVASNWAGNGPGSLYQCGALGLPRIGSEVLVAFLGGDPDRPVIVGQLYNQNAQPPALSSAGQLPGNRYLSGIKSREIGGQRGNQLRFDDGSGQISAQLASDHGASQLNLGWLTQPKTDGHGEPRGEGAELRSDLALALRGAAGVLISADARSDAQGGLLDRGELVTIAEAIVKLAGQLSKLAVTHAQDAAAGEQLTQLLAHLKEWHQGSNLAQGGAGGAGGAPMVALSGPAGVVLGSGLDLALGAKGNIDAVSGGDTTLSAGASALLRASQDISVFANQGDIKLVTAMGKVKVQSQDESMELLARKVLEIISNTDWITIKAKLGVRINGGGTELVLSADGIKGYSSGKHEMHAADHQTFPAQNKPVEFPGAQPCATRTAGAAQDGSASVPVEKG